MSQSDERKVANVEIETHKGTGFFGGDEYTATVTLDDGTTRSTTSTSKDYAIERSAEKAKNGSWW
jgi:hypothetical protein